MSRTKERKRPELRTKKQTGLTQKANDTCQNWITSMRAASHIPPTPLIPSRKWYGTLTDPRVRKSPKNQHKTPNKCLEALGNWKDPFEKRWKIETLLKEPRHLKSVVPAPMVIANGLGNASALSRAREKWRRWSAGCRKLRGIPIRSVCSPKKKTEKRNRCNDAITKNITY